MRTSQFHVGRTPTYCVYSRDVHETLLVERRDRGVDNSSPGETETKAFRVRNEMRPRRTNSEARQSGGITAPRDRGVKTEAASHIHIIPRLGKPRTEAEPKWHIQMLAYYNLYILTVYICYV